ncbi:MAG: signal peptidase II [Spirochaetes bacterium]|nr:signal peptidase II [Spirochaetota bacterium]
MKFDKERMQPLILSAVVVLLDQITKIHIASNWPINSFITDVFDNDLLHIIHVRNPAIAFSLGYTLPPNLRFWLFVVFPLLVLVFLLWYYFRTDEFNKAQRWAVAAIVGGGAGNLIDRIFRPDGVVDFISVRFFGILGFERWPTFNVADSSVVVGSILMFVSILISPGVSKPGDSALPPQDTPGE